MALITLSELKAVLGIGDIYADALVQECADAAENILLSLLTKNQWAVVAHSRTNLINTIYTDRPHDVYVGESVICVTNSGTNFNGTKTITKVTDYSMSFTGTGSDYRNTESAHMEQYLHNTLIIRQSQKSAKPQWLCLRYLDHAHWHTWPARCGLPKPSTIPTRPISIYPSIRLDR